MSDFAQFGPVTTLHDLTVVPLERLEHLLREATKEYKIGLILPVTAADMRGEPFRQIVQSLRGADYIDTIVITLGVAPEVADYQDTLRAVAPLGDRVGVLWTDGARVQTLYAQLNQAGFHLSRPGKGRSVWTAFGYLLADPELKAFALHDCDIVDYDRLLLTRLCLPMAHPSLDFEFCKAFYARCTDRMHGRVVRLLVAPLLDALMTTFGRDPFLTYMASFRYPLSGEFAVTSTLARSNRVASDWGLEVGTLAEVYRNTAVKRVCQVDLCRFYEHKHQSLSLDDSSKGLMKMSHDIVMNLFRTLASRGMAFDEAHFLTLRATFLRAAQDAIRQYHADALINGLWYDRHAEEQTVEAFASLIPQAGSQFREAPGEQEDIPNWARVLAAFAHLPHTLRDCVCDDLKEFGTSEAGA